MTEKVYPSDMTDKQWAEMEPLIRKQTKRGRIRRSDMRNVVNGIFYLLRSGCQWAMLPKEYGSMELVKYYFYQWRKDGTWNRILTHVREKYRQKVGKNAKPTAAAMDSQSVKTAGKGRRRGYDAGKHVKGRKRNITVDTLGLLLGVVVTSAYRSDTRAARLLLIRVWQCCASLLLIWVDHGYKQGFLDWAKGMFGVTIDVVKRTGRAFQLLPKRWIAERSFAWTDQYRRNAKDYEQNPLNAEAIYTACFCHIILKKLIPT